MALLRTILFISLFMGGIPMLITAQVKIGNNPRILQNGDSSAVLILEDTTRGFLMPRMTLKQRNSLKPATGLAVFVTDNATRGYYVNYGTPTVPNWVKLSNSVKDTILISHVDTIINKVIQTDSIFSNSGRIDTIYNKISRVDTLFAKTAHFDTVTIGKLKIRISGNLNDSIVVVNPINDSVKRISPNRLLSNVSNGKIDTIINLLIRSDSIFSNSARIDTIYNKISRVDTLFAKTAHFDTVTIGKLKIRISGNLNDSIVVVNPINDSVKRISPTRLISNIAFVQQGNTFATTAILGTRDANDLKIITNGDTLMTFKYANKSIGIGKTLPGYNLEIGGNMRCDTIYTKYVKMSADNSFSTFAVSLTGGIMVVSDSKYKENIQPYTKNALNALAQIPIVSYDWKNKDITPRHVSIGVIAQDVQKVLPDVVETDKAGNLSLKFNNFTYYLMKAVQELNIKTITQEQELSAIKQEMKNMENKNQTLQQQIDKLQSMVEALMKK